MDYNCVWIGIESQNIFVQGFAQLRKDQVQPLALADWELGLKIARICSRNARLILTDEAGGDSKGRLGD